MSCLLRSAPPFGGAAVELEGRLASVGGTRKAALPELPCLASVCVILTSNRGEIVRRLDRRDFARVNTGKRLRFSTALVLVPPPGHDDTIAL